MKTHPYIADLPIFEDRVEQMAESIAEIGLLHPISLDSEGRIIGGRHRLAACEKAGVEPTFETREEDPLAFMLSDNDDRKHQTAGQLAAEKAITLAKAGRRENGRWTYRAAQKSQVGISSKAARNRLSEAGLILDVLGEDILRSVAVGDLPFSEAEEKAVAERQRREAEEHARIEEARDEQAREDKAGRYFDNHPEAQAWLNSKPQGTFETMRGAYAAYLEHDREARRAEQQKREAERREKQELEDRRKRIAARLSQLAPAIRELRTLKQQSPAERDAILSHMSDFVRTEFEEVEGEITC